MQNDNKDFKNYVETLPTELKQAIYSVDYPQKLQKIVKNNKLLIDQAGKLEAETTLVLAGIEPLDKYIGNLIRNVGLTSMQASLVAHDVDELIFKNIRESLKKINDDIKDEDKIAGETAQGLATSWQATQNVAPLASETANPTKENILAGIENPENIKVNEPSISLSSLESKKTTPEFHPEMVAEGIEIKTNNLPEIAPEILPTISSLTKKQEEPFHQNISPVPNIVESKLANIVIAPKENIVIEEKTKLPQKPRLSADPYKEPII